MWRIIYILLYTVEKFTPLAEDTVSQLLGWVGEAGPDPELFSRDPHDETLLWRSPSGTWSWPPELHPPPTGTALGDVLHLSIKGVALEIADMYEGLSLKVFIQVRDEEHFEVVDVKRYQSPSTQGPRASVTSRTSLLYLDKLIIFASSPAFLLSISS